MDRLVKGIWIPIEIWEDSNLSWNEKIVLMEIDSFTSQGKDCFFSDEYIASVVGISDRTARRILAHLIELGYIRKTHCDGRKRYIESTLCVQADRTKCPSRVDKIVRSDRTKCPNNNISIINKDNIDRDINISIHKSSKFVKPSLDEVAQEIERRGSSVDPESFYAYYESNGWMVGRNPMKNWKAAITTWERQRKSGTFSKPETHKENVFEHNARALAEAHAIIEARRKYDGK